MADILKGDLYRFGKSKLLYVFAALAALAAVSLMALIRQDMRLGVSVFGNLTAFRAPGDIVRTGVEYHKGLGIFAAILLSVFIGQEYQWKTWQHKLIAGKSRARAYLSKAAFSSAGSALIFLAYEAAALLSAGQMRGALAKDCAAALVCGLFVYAALGTVICMLSMLIKNSAASTAACLCYVLLGEAAASAMRGAGSLSAAAGRLVELGVRHSVYGMSATVSSAAFTAEGAAGVAINALAIMLLSTALGLLAFR
ncbi:MAG: hypothetical protein LBL83_06995, partial [Clostridiales bacterium]|nr:hypothetical protein [Clostridiales bacterium]